MPQINTSFFMLKTHDFEEISNFNSPYSWKPEIRHAQNRKFFTNFQESLVTRILKSKVLLPIEQSFCSEFVLRRFQYEIYFSSNKSKTKFYLTLNVQEKKTKSSPGDLSSVT